MRGYFGIGIVNGKIPVNIGTLWRSAKLLGADFIFTIKNRYKAQKSDTMKAYQHMPLLHFESLSDLKRTIHRNCYIIGVELDNKAIPIAKFSHPSQCVYLLGAEDFGLTWDIRQQCHSLIQLPGDYSMNVSVAGSLVMYDRMMKNDGNLLSPRDSSCV